MYSPGCNLRLFIPSDRRMSLSLPLRGRRLSSLSASQHFAAWVFVVNLITYSVGLGLCAFIQQVYGAQTSAYLVTGERFCAAITSFQTYTHFHMNSCLSFDFHRPLVYSEHNGSGLISNCVFFIHQKH